MFAVILFAKFATHHVRHHGKPVEKPSRSGWYWAHWACVATAWLGLLASFVILAEGWSSRPFEMVCRGFAGAMALISGTLLAWDVAVTGRNPLEHKAVDAESLAQNTEANP
jgi:hypothetical protein